MSVDAISQKKYFLSDLFPRNMDEPRVGKFLVDRLYEYQLILTKALEASQKLISHEFERFDGIAGDSACQIRAIKIALIASKKLIDLQDFSDRLTKTKSNLDSILTPIQRKEIQQHKQSLRQIIDAKQLDVSISSEELFAVQCYILGEATELVIQKENGIEYMTSLQKKLDRSSPKKILPPNTKISGGFAHDLLIRLKTEVSEASVQFVQQLASDTQDRTLIEMVSRKIRHDAHNAHLSCIPAFFGMQALLHVAQKENIPIVVCVKFLTQESTEKYKVTGEKSLFYKPSEEARGSYVLVEPSKEDLEKPACIIAGCAVCSEADWNLVSAGYSITDAILAFMAAHNQYPGNHRESKDFDTPEFVKYKKMAEERGFSINNPKTLFLQHIYSAKPLMFLNGAYPMQAV